MIPYWQLNGSQLYQGHVLDVLKALAAESVHCIVTSPPYWGLRDYGLPPVEWPAVNYAPMAGLPAVEVPGCEEGCEHVWGEEQVITFNPERDYRHGVREGTRGKQEWTKGTSGEVSKGQFCQLCGGWRGSLGLEPTIEMFVGHLVLVWRELWRVLRDDGTCWLNLGDSYATSQAGNKTWGDGVGSNRRYESGAIGLAKRNIPSGLKQKDLCAIPWRVALALQADGWYLRSDIIWAKGVSFCSTYSGSCMPESVRDRPTKGHEYIFLLAKSKRYYYDAEAVREQNAPASFDRFKYSFDGLTGYHNDNSDPKGGGLRGSGGLKGYDPEKSPAGRNLRSVWLINPGSYAGAHFATFPPPLVEPMILAGTSERGCCPSCGAPWERMTERMQGKPQHTPGGNTEKMHTAQGQHDATSLIYTGGGTQTVTTGWRLTCTCSEQEPIPCTVLDPFTGSGTTLEAAIKLRRRGVGIELSKEYCDNHIIPRLEKPLQMELAL